MPVVLLSNDSHWLTHAEGTDADLVVELYESRAMGK